MNVGGLMVWYIIGRADGIHSLCDSTDTGNNKPVKVELNLSSESWENSEHNLSVFNSDFVQVYMVLFNYFNSVQSKSRSSDKIF